MKKFAVALVMLSVGALGLSAASNDSSIFYENFPIVKAYIMQEGYRLVYRNGSGQLHDLYVPMSWFGTASSKAVLVSGQDKTYPYFTVYWSDGKFDYIKLYLNSDLNDSSWGILPPNFDPTGKFPQDDSLTIDTQ